MNIRMLVFASALALAPAAVAQTQQPVTAPDQFFKQPVGSDYYLANYSEYEAYLRRLAAESDRIRLVDIGKTAEGRSQWMAVISSSANLARLDEYRAIAEKLARGRVSEAEARTLAQTGKAVVWIDAGMHATETVTSQGQIQVIHRMLTQSDAETLRILDDCILLFGHDNPDGMELVSDWYMRHADPKKRSFATLPRLYQKYVGHDNNRDSFMAQMPETENVNRVLYRQWYPQIVYNQHQTGPEGMVVFVPPFRDPFNFNYDPIVMSQLSEVGHAMHSRLIAEGKAGSGMRSAARYSTWHNGMERSSAYFHNSIGLLTEIIGGPTPSKIPLVPTTQLPRSDEPMPIAPRDWHLQDSLDYQWSLNRAVMDYASRNRERLLFNIWRMGANSIARGSRDSWTMTPTKVERLKTAAPIKQENGEGARGVKKVDPALYEKLVQVPAERDPRAYVIPVEQRDLPTAVTFLNALIKAGVEVERADRPFRAGGKDYSAGSFIVRSAQAYRPHVLDMFEPQDHPHDTEYPGGPPQAPYDITGYTLAYQMGVGFDRVLDGFEASTIPLDKVMAPPPGQVYGAGTAGWLVDHTTNNSFILTNRLLKAGIPVRWMKRAVNAGDRAMQPGAIWVPESAEGRRIVERGVAELGIDAYSLTAQPGGDSIALKPVRIGLVDRWGGLMSAGWTRWLLEQFEFPYTQIFPKRVDAGNLQRDYSVLVFTDDALPPSGAWGRSQPTRQPDEADTPPELRDMLGHVTDETSMPQIARFVQDGGAVVAIGSSGRIAELLNAPLGAALSRQVDGKHMPLERREFYIPGSILRARIDPTQPLGFGMPEEADMFSLSSQSFKRVPGIGVAQPVSWFEGSALLRSGWAVGQEKLAGTIAVADVDIGRGKLFLMGPEVAQRAQSYGTYKLLFNALLYGAAER